MPPSRLDCKVWKTGVLGGIHLATSSSLLEPLGYGCRRLFSTVHFSFFETSQTRRPCHHAPCFTTAEGYVIGSNTAPNQRTKKQASSYSNIQRTKTSIVTEAGQTSPYEDNTFRKKNTAGSHAAMVGHFQPRQSLTTSSRTPLSPLHVAEPAPSDLPRSFPPPASRAVDGDAAAAAAAADPRPNPFTFSVATSIAPAVSPPSAPSVDGTAGSVARACRAKRKRLQTARSRPFRRDMPTRPPPPPSDAQHDGG